MAELQSYNHRKIQRYLRQKMTPQEMHDFEKDLMNDPFLADALDGFLLADSNLAEQHLSEIKIRFTGQKEKAKVVSMTLQKTWWKVAAIVFFVAAGGTFFYSLITRYNDKKSAVRQETVAKAAEKKTITDSIEPAEKPLAQVDISPKKKPFTKRAVSTITRQKELPMAMRSMQVKGDSLQLNATAEKEKDIASLNNSSTFSRLAAPKVSNNSRQEMEAGKIAMSASQPQKKSTGKVLDEKAIVTSLKSLRVKNNEAEATPISGWRNFEDYVIGQVNSFKTNVQYSRHEVELTFSIDNNGRPSNIKVSAQTDKIIAEKAIEILKNGPAWKSKRDDKTLQLIIPF